jgi:hypothetical protein
MFDRIDPLFKTLFRHTENADTRQDIKRKTPEQEQRKKDTSKEDKENNPLWDDETDVSIEALSSFLGSLLGNKNQIFNSNTGQKPSAPAPSNNYAINAYQKNSENKSSKINITENVNPTEDSDLTLQDKDIPLIEKLLEELQTLKKHNIEYLVISRKGTFFDSVKDAIQNAYDNLS